MLRKFVFTLLAVVLISPVWISAVSAGQEKVTVCHKPGTTAEATLEIAAPAEAAHLGHGDYSGACQGPQSDGCTALNALVPDPQMNPDYYFFGFEGLVFFPGETIHVSITAASEESTEPGAPPGYALVAVQNNDFGPLAVNYQEFTGESTVSVNYVVVAGDNAGTGFIESGGPAGGFTVLNVDFSCTPAP